MSLFKVNISNDQAKDTGMAMVLIILLMGLFFKSVFFFKLAIPIQIINMIFPLAFKYIAVIWLGLSHLLGTFVSKVLLGVTFFFIVTPMGLFRRIVGIDSLKLNQFKKGNKSVMVIRNIKFRPTDIERPY